MSSNEEILPQRPRQQRQQQQRRRPTSPQHTHHRNTTNLLLFLVALVSTSSLVIFIRSTTTTTTTTTMKSLDFIANTHPNNTIPSNNVINSSNSSRISRSSSSSTTPTTVETSIMTQRVYDFRRGFPEPEFLDPVDIDRSLSSSSTPNLQTLDETHLNGRVHTGVWVHVIDSSFIHSNDHLLLLLKRGPELVSTVL
jgi:hypothetical protein